MIKFRGDELGEEKTEYMQTLYNTVYVKGHGGVSLAAGV